MSDDFGDYENDDAYDPSPPDPEQVAIKLHNLRRMSESLPEWNSLTPTERFAAIAIMARLIIWLRRQGGIR